MSFLKQKCRNVQYFMQGCYAKAMFVVYYAFSFAKWLLLPNIYFNLDVSLLLLSCQTESLIENKKD